MTLIERLRIAATDDHERGCQGRNFACTCGYDAATQIACQDAARALEAADRALEAADAMAQAMIDVDNAFSRREHINAALDAADVAVKAYRAATKGKSNGRYTG
jgi:hypothetical protein